MAKPRAPSSTPGVQAPLWTEDGKVRHVLFRRLVPSIPSTTYATFGLYRYPAKFIPQVVAYVLQAYARPGMRVFDPFAGYGTVGIVARLYGCPYELWDLNPLLTHLHTIATMKPVSVDLNELLRQMIEYDGPPYYPDWTRLTYWFPEEFLPFLGKIWGYYHSLTNEQWKNLLLIPLLKTTRFFSYADERVHKLYRSHRAAMKIAQLLQQNWHESFIKNVRERIVEVNSKLVQYERMHPRLVEWCVLGGVDSFSLQRRCEADFLITSPPYLQAQEYIRTVKMDLFWLGYTESFIKDLSRLEIPYCAIPSCPILSETYHYFRNQIHEKHLRVLFERYFHAVLGTLTRLQQSVLSRLFLFVGPATLRGAPIPIDRIFVEHFNALGWRHEATLIDTVIARVMFAASRNPATGLRDKRIPSEHLVIFRRV